MQPQLTYADAEGDLDESLQGNGQVDAVLDALHQHQRADAPRASPVDAHDACACGRRMHSDGYGVRWSMAAEEAVGDVECPGVFVAAMPEYD